MSDQSVLYDQNGKRDNEENMSGKKAKRPYGLTIIAILWSIFGLYNIYSAYQTLSSDIEGLAYLSGYGLHPWFSIAIPAELALSIISICLGLLQMITVFGLWMGKKYSYTLALAIPIAFVIINLSFLGLYLSAPSEVDLDFNVSILGGLVGGGIVWTLIYWQYLRKPHVKAYLGIE